MGVTWYMANDMQFYILSPLFILPLWKSFWLGLIWWSVVMVGMTCVIGYFVIHYQLAPAQMFLFMFNPANNLGIDMSLEFYMRPYIRFQPYMIGILFGYAMYKTRGSNIKIPHVSEQRILAYFVRESNTAAAWAVVVAQLVERLLPTPEISSSNPVINNFIYYQLF